MKGGIKDVKDKTKGCNSTKKSNLEELQQRKETNENCMRLTRLQKHLHDTLLSDKVDKKIDKKIVKKRHRSFSSDENKCCEIITRKFHAQRKFAPSGVDDSSVPATHSKMKYKKLKREVATEPVARPENAICEKAPDTAVFITYLCFHDTNFKPNLNE